MKGLQLPLGVRLSGTASFESFYPGPNAEALAAVRRVAQTDAPPLTVLYGAAGAGKSHLLQALVREQAAAGTACAYVPLRGFAAAGPEVLDGLEQCGIVCLDDAGEVVASPDWAVALLRLLDTLRAQGGRCALSAAAAPERMDTALPDLRTRLNAGATFGLKPFSDVEREHFLLERARGRGLQLPPEVARFLLSRLPRDTTALLDSLDSLDQASLAAQRRLTLPFVQRWLQTRDGAG